MSVTIDYPELEVQVSQPIDIQIETPIFEEQIRILEEENARLRDTLQFFVEMCCLKE